MPSNRDMRHPTSGSGIAVFIGILVSQIGAVFLVHSANTEFYKEMAAIIARGYVAVPSASVMAGLSSWFNAFMGAVFFTVTTGILIVFISLAVLRWMQSREWTLPRQIGIMTVLWLLLVAFLNSTGFNSGATLYVTVVMAAVAAAGAVSGALSPGGGRRLRHVAIVFGPLILLTGLWLTRLDAALFVEIRDRLLFSNPVGVKVVEFYYDYTLYGAQVMAPLTQHTLVGVDMSSVADADAYRELADRLRWRDVLDVGRAVGSSAVLTAENGDVWWQDPTGRRLSVAQKDILIEPGVFIDGFSKMIDRNGPFRLLTLAGILVGFPVMLYLFVFAVVEGLLAPILGNRATAVAALVCLVIGVVLFYPLAAAPRASTNGIGTAALWRDGGLSGRISVLKQAVDNGTDPLQYPDADALGQSARMVERYWFARALSNTRSTRGFELLERMMNDISPLVICQVCYALGEMKNPRAIPILLSAIQNGGDWYAQRYAYAALRKLGWIQPPRYR